MKGTKFAHFSRRIILAMLFLAGSQGLFAASPFTVRRTGASRPPDLHDQLSKGLKARKPDEFAFIDRVVTLVDQRKLPLKFVNASYQSAKKRATSNRKDYPVIYFRRTLELLTAKAGIDLYQPLN